MLRNCEEYNRPLPAKSVVCTIITNPEPPDALPIPEAGAGDQALSVTDTSTAPKIAFFEYPAICQSADGSPYRFFTDRIAQLLNCF
jgi:hypothetical protein